MSNLIANPVYYTPLAFYKMRAYPEERKLCKEWMMKHCPDTDAKNLEMYEACYFPAPFGIRSDKTIVIEEDSPAYDIFATCLSCGSVSTKRKCACGGKKEPMPKQILVVGNTPFRRYDDDDQFPSKSLLFPDGKDLLSKLSDEETEAALYGDHPRMVEKFYKDDGPKKILEDWMFNGPPEEWQNGIPKETIEKYSEAFLAMATDYLKLHPELLT